MNRKSCSCACRTFVLGAAALLIPICMATAPPYSDANLPGHSSFGQEWAILSNDIFFGGVDALFGLSPASRTLLLSAASDSKTTSARNASVTEAQIDDLFSFASPIGSPISYSAGGGFAPNAVAAIKQFDGATTGNADPATGASTSWSTVEAWRLDGVPTASDDVLFDNAWRTPLQNVQLGGANRAANSITLSLTNNQTWSLGASSGSGNAALALTTGNITRTATTNNSLITIGAISVTGIGTGVITLTTPAVGFTLTNLDTTGNLQINAIISGATKTVTTVGPGTTIFTGTNTYTGTTTVSSGTLLVNGNNSAATGVVNVTNAGTLLGGTGIIGGSVTIDTEASITGGTSGSVGTLTLTSNLTFTFGSFLVDLTGASADMLAIGGNLDLSGALDQLTLNGTPDGTSSYTLATYMSHSGVFDIDNVPMNYQLIYGADSLILAPIPEPGPWIGAALALGAIGLMSRKSHRAKSATSPT